MSPLVERLPCHRIPTIASGPHVRQVPSELQTSIATPDDCFARGIIFWHMSRAPKNLKYVPTSISCPAFPFLKSGSHFFIRA